MYLSSIFCFLLSISFSSSFEENKNVLSDSKRINRLEEKVEKLSNRLSNACSLGEQSSEKHCFTQRNEDSHYTLNLSYCSKDNTTIPSPQIDLQAKIRSTGITEFSLNDKSKSGKEAEPQTPQVAGCSCSDLQKLIQNSGKVSKKELRNIALYKPTQSSSIHYTSSLHQFDSKAVDGDFTTRYSSSAIPAHGPKAWLMIDLGTDTAIEYIKFIGDPHAIHRLGNLMVYFTKTFNPTDSFSNYHEILYVSRLPSSSTPLYKIRNSVSGRYIVIERQLLSDHLDFIEVLIFAFV